MNQHPTIRCRVAACRDVSDDDNAWRFYLINDGDAPIDLAVLYAVDYAWGGMGNREDADVRITDLAPGAHALIWQDDGDGAEVRMDLSLRVQVGGRRLRLRFEFPKLYRKRNLPVVEGLGKPGWAVAAEGRVDGSI